MNSEEIEEALNKELFRRDPELYRQIQTEKFLREFKDELDWKEVSKYQNLSEDFIFEFQDYVNWANISRYQCLSSSFVHRMKDFIVMTELSKNVNLYKS